MKGKSGNGKMEPQRNDDDDDDTVAVTAAADRESFHRDTHIPPPLSTHIHTHSDSSESEIEEFIHNNMAT